MKKTRLIYTLCVAILILTTFAMGLAACQRDIPTQNPTHPQSMLTLHFDGNGGQGDMASIDCERDKEILLPHNTFVKSGYDFVGWSTELSGQVIYTDQQKITLAEDITLYAVWQMKTYNIEYILPNGELDYANPSGFSIEKLPIILAPPSLVMDGYIFEGWYTTPSYAENSKVSQITKLDEKIYNDGTLTLYAKYDKVSEPVDPIPPGEDTQPMLPIQPGEHIEPMLPITPGESIGQKDTDFIFSLSSDQSYYILTGYVGQSKDIVLPSFHQGKPVKEIGAKVFANRQDLSSVVVPEGVTSIGESAFDSCANLKSITLPSTLTYIDTYGFWACDALGEVHIADIASWCAITFDYQDANPLTYAHHLYLDDREVTNLIIPDNVKMIKDYAFYGCEGLVSIDMPSSVTKIGKQCFFGCDGLQWLRIQDLASWCGVNFVDKESNPLYFAHNLYINQYLVEDLHIPSGVKSISKYAFINCTSIKSVSIPNSVQNIGEDGFDGCQKTQKVYASDIASWCSITFGNDKANPMYYSRCLYLAGELLTNLIVPDSVRQIKDYTFFRGEDLERVSIPNAVISIGKYAFYECKNLASITLPDRLESIGDNAFTNCIALREISLPYTLQKIGNYTFMACEGLESVYIPDSVTMLGDYAFARCTNLVDVSIGVGVDRIGEQVFAGCTYLVSVSMSDRVESIGDYAFWHCYSLRDIDMPSALVNVGKGAFNTCSSLSSIDLPNGVASIGADAFSFCNGLYSVFIPNSVADIGAYAFANCVNAKIYIESAEVPITWDSQWNISGQKVIFGCARDITYSFVSEGEQIQSFTAKGGVLLPNIPNDTANGKYFLGWYDNASYVGERISSPYQATQDSTLYAKWGDKDDYDRYLDSYHNGESFDRAKVAIEHNIVSISKPSQVVYYSFTPTESRQYKFTSYGAKGNAYLSLYDEHKQMLEYSYGRFDFELSYRLQAGKTYYLAVNYLGDSVIGDFSFDII